MYPQKNIRVRPIEMEKDKLVQRIWTFLDTYAKIRPDWDPEFDEEDEKYTSPDASILTYCARSIENGIKPQITDSSWSSGGYGPYMSKEGREEHDDIIKQIRKWQS